ncbi:HAMP domain-containing protein [Paenibacillus sp. HJL G12]|uniref:histidine kinase n=1 Tax=Paenibacillus dendrobii TaxID=2691084 RepID=A0A7X3II91_9BACL|nr:ATP-binding protein [Paenibacillus dendrobii]MWV42572.1 HAMP domain-containing protein [Paenibacillus dendrobii]
MSIWKKGRLTTKVYWTTAISFLLFVTLFMVLQFIFFKPYSLQVRGSQLEKDFRSMYGQLQEHISSNLSKVSMNRLSEFDSDHYSLSGIVYKQGNDVQVYLGNRPLKTVPIELVDPAKKLSVHLIMANPDDAVTYPRKTIELPSQSKADEQQNKARIRKIVTPIHWYNADAERLNNMLQSKLGDMLQQQLHEGVTTQIFNQGVAGMSENERIWAAIAPLSPDQGQERYLVTVSTLEPVSDAESLLGGFYRYFYIAAVILLLGFAFLFSRMISSPLVQLNTMAKRLARLDFSVRADMKREDEIGELAQTFDYLATELNSTMEELKDANEQLLLDIEKERQLEKLRKRFVASVSHELKTPVSLIQGYAEALRDNVGEGVKRDKYAAVIIHESERMSRLVNDLLDLSQLESGRFRLHFEHVHLRQIIISVLRTLEPMVTGRRLQLNWNIVQNEVDVRSDAQRLQQIFTNILTNAIRHATGDGDIKITVSMTKKRHASTPAQEGVSWVQVLIFNPGRSIPDEHIPHLWDAFYRTDESGSRNDGGNGIGLSIVKNLLELHESKYAIRNVEGGVAVYFTLPLSSLRQ